MKLSFHNKEKFFKLVDALLTSGVCEFKCEIISVQGTILDEDGKAHSEVLELWKQNPVECIHEILGNPALRDTLHYEPEKVFSSYKCKEQFYNKAWTGEWWWDIQVRLTASFYLCSEILKALF
jgi:hypothetical protein